MVRRGEEDTHQELFKCAAYCAQQIFVIVHIIKYILTIYVRLNAAESLWKWMKKFANFHFVISG